MNNSYKKVIIPHIFQLLLTFSLIGTMFLSNTYHYYQSTTYDYYYYYGYRLSVPSYKNNYDYYNFFESVTYDGGTGTIGALVFLFTFLSIVLSIVALASKKHSYLSLVALVIPFAILFWYGTWLLYTETFTSEALDEEGFFMFIPLGLMIINTIVGLFSFVKKHNANKAMDAQAQAVADNSFPTSGWSLNGSVQTSAVPKQKTCPHCGNICADQAAICVRCGSKF